MNSKDSVGDTFKIKATTHWTGKESGLYYGMGFAMSVNQNCFTVDKEQKNGDSGEDDTDIYTFTVKKLCRASIDFKGEDRRTRSNPPAKWTNDGEDYPGISIDFKTF